MYEGLKKLAHWAWEKRTWLFGTASRRPRPRVAAPTLEVLEERAVPSFTSTTPAQINATEGTQFSGTVATFMTDTPSDTFTASINWGDGTTTTGTVTPNVSFGLGFTVSGSHTYLNEGAPNVTVTLTEMGTSPATMSVPSSATVAEADSLAVTGVNFSATAGTAFNGTVANFTNTNTANVAADFTATINWGDGTSSQGTVNGANGNFTVTGNHTYTNGGQFTASVQVADIAPGTASGSANSTASVDFPRLSQTLQVQIALGVAVQPGLQDPQALMNLQADALRLYFAAVQQSGLQAAQQLVNNEVQLVQDLEIQAVEVALGVNDPALQNTVNQLGYQISSSPLYNTPVGFGLGLETGALAIKASTG
jgi:hypothetical protein